MRAGGTAYRYFPSPILANEAEMRAMLRLSLDPQVPLHEVALRQGRRTIWVADALAPLRGALTQSRFEQLTLAIAAAAGRATAAAILKSSCNALLEHELRG